MSAPKSMTWRLLALFLTFGLFAAACGSSGDGETSDTTGGDDNTETGGDGTEAPTATDAVTATVAETIPEAGPERGGTLRIGTEAEVNGVNPTTSSLSAPGLWMGITVFDTLTAYTPEGVVVPYLAESLTPSDDLRSWTIKVRDGISFHDGTPVDADALIANFDSAYNHPLVGLAVKPFYPAEDNIEKIDDLTVEYKLLDPDANFPASLTGQLGMVASPTWLAATAEDPALSQEPVGSGPFIFESRSQDQFTRFVRNDDWWGIGVMQDDIWLDAVEFHPLTDTEQRLDQLDGGDLEMFHTTVSGAIPILQDLQDSGDVQVQFDDQTEESFAMINSSRPPFDDIRVRQALTFATPRNLYNELIAEGVNRPADQPFTPDSPYYNPDVKQEADMPERSGELIAAYCAERGDELNDLFDPPQPTCTDGKVNMELQWSGPSVVQDRIADLLRDEGWSEFFNVTFQELLQDAHIQEVAFGTYNVVTWRQFGAVDPSRDKVWLMCRTVGGISLNWPQLCDEGRDALILEGDSGVTDERFVEIQQEISQNMNEAYTYIFFNHTIWGYAYGTNVHNLCGQTDPDGTKLRCLESGRTNVRAMYMDQ